MKRLLSYFRICGFILMISCVKDEGNESGSKPYTPPPKDPCTMSQRAMVNCIILNPKNGKFFLAGPVSLSFIITTPSPSYEISFGTHQDSLKVISRQSENSFTLTNLAPSQTYYWKFSASGLCGGCLAGISKFTVVQDTTIPYVEIHPVPDNQNLPVPVTVDVLSQGSAPLIDCGIFYGAFSKPQITGTKISAGKRIGLFSLKLDTLKENTDYYAVAYAINSYGTFYGKEVEFRSGSRTEPEPVTDIDGNHYGSVIIGNQLWMKENLKTKRFNDGTAIPFVTDNIAWSSLTPKRTWLNNDSSYAAQYGIIYNGFVATSGKVCPTGWHVPTEEEWKNLEYFLGMSVYDAAKIDMRGTTEGLLMKSDSGWLENGNGQNTYGFTGLGGGYRHPNGSFASPGAIGQWWSSSKDQKYDYSWCRSLIYNASGISRTLTGMQYGCSIRCIKD
ncbi:MAG: fibrobacter succinogenes major paralogous domain-containing protein [Chloroflexota bacterium]